MADLCSISLLHRRKMHLAPTVERYMDLKRQERVVRSDFGLMQQKPSVSVIQFSSVSELLSIPVCLFCDPNLSALSQVCMTKSA